MEASTVSELVCLGNRCSESGTVVIIAKGGDQLVLEDASNDGIRYLVGGVQCLIRGVRGGSSFETESAKFYGTVDEDPTCLPQGRTMHIDVRHDLVRDACDSGKIRVVCVRTRTCSLIR